MCPARRKAIFTAEMLIVTAMVLCIAGCSGRPAKKAGKLTVAVTIAPQAYVAEKIAGGRARVLVMVPPGASPHSYEPRAGQLRGVAEAQLYLKLGTGLEFEVGGLGKLAGVNPRMKIVDTSAGIRLLRGHEHSHEQGGEHEEHGGNDPHIWLSPRLLKAQAANMEKAMAAADPENTAAYKKNLTAFDAEMDALDAKIREVFSGAKTRTMITYHPAWTYFCADYGLKQEGVEFAGKEPRGEQLSHIISIARKDKIKVIFIEPQFDRRGAEAVAAEIGGRVETLDPLAPDVGANLLEVAKKIAGQ